MRRVRRNLMMMVQVSMLSDQIHNQTDKILDLERTLDSKKEALKKTEDLLQIEMINRLNILDTSFLWNWSRVRLVTRSDLKIDVEMTMMLVCL